MPLHPNQDTLQRFIFEKQDIRGEIVHLNKSFQDVMDQYHYPETVHKLLGETIAASVLLSATIKYKGQLTLQFQSDGPIKLLITKCTHEFSIRGLARFDPDEISTYPLHQKLLQEGSLIATFEQNNHPQPYQSIIPIEKSSIAENLESYFAKSEQLATRIWLAVNEHQAAGMLLQLTPTESIRTREQFWEHAVKLGETITPKELLTLDNRTILRRLYHEEDIILFEPDFTTFKCTCTRERMIEVLKALGHVEVFNILQEKKDIKITCEFCNSEYIFDKPDVEKIFVNH